MFFRTGKLSVAAVLLRLCRSAPVLPVGRTRGAVGHFSGRAGFRRRCFVPALPFCSGSSGRQDTRGGRTFLRSGRFPSPLFCSSSAVLLRFFRSAGHAGRSDISPVGQVSLAAVLLRLCRSAPVLPVGGTRGAV